MTGVRGIGAVEGSEPIDDSGDWFAADRPLATCPGRLGSAYVNGESSLSWSDAVSVFRSQHGPERRFGERWASGLWRRWFDRDRTLVERTETTLMVSLTASPWLSTKCLLPPAHHLDAVVNGRDAVLDELADCLDCEFRVGWALGAQKTGYVDCHVGIWCFDRTDPVAVEPALQTYVDTVHTASQDEHGAGAITAYHGADMLADRTATDNREPATRLGAYLADNVPGSGSQPEYGMGVENELVAGDGHRIQVATLLDATGTEAYRRPRL